jgi:hypothetical protein
VDKAKALIELERNFRSDLSSEKESEESSDSKKGSNYKTDLLSMAFYNTTTNCFTQT